PAADWPAGDCSDEPTAHLCQRRPADAAAGDFGPGPHRRGAGADRGRLPALGSQRARRGRRSAGENPGGVPRRHRPAGRRARLPERRRGLDRPGQPAARADAQEVPRRALPQGGRGPLLRRRLRAVHPPRGRQGLRGAVQKGRPDLGARRDHPLVRHGAGAALRRDPLLHRPGGLGRALHRQRHRHPLPPLRAGRMKAILTDLEGTTSSISFVKDVLFPYARRALPGFVEARGQEPEVRRWLDQVAAELGGACQDAMVVEVLQGWIDEDRKHTALKALQGMIWADGYRGGEFHSYFYPDAVEAMQRWHDAGIPIHVYSSGSVPAQRMLFGHSSHGDLTGLVSGWYDTTSGPKREAESYRRIAAEIGLPAREILFLS